MPAQQRFDVLSIQMKLRDREFQRTTGNAYLKMLAPAGGSCGLSRVPHRRSARFHPHVVVLEMCTVVLIGTTWYGLEAHGPWLGSGNAAAR
jgi:hypothetical protein